MRVSREGNQARRGGQQNRAPGAVVKRIISPQGQATRGLFLTPHTKYSVGVVVLEERMGIWCLETVQALTLLLASRRAKTCEGLCLPTCKMGTLLAAASLANIMDT